MRHDLQYAIRLMRRSPGFAAAAVLCIALGIGANTTMFSLINAAMLRTLPVSDPQRLAIVDSFDEQGNVINSFSYPQYLSMHAHARGLVLLARTYVNEFNLSAGDVTDRPAGELVSDSYFSVLGISPAMGRTILPADDNVLVLSHRFWKGRFQGDRSIVGRTMNLNGLAFTVIGVAPSGFSGVEVGRAPDIFVPLAARDRLMPGTPTLKSNDNFWLDVIGRLAPAVTRKQAAAEIDVLYDQANSEQTTNLPADSNLLRYLRGMRVRLAPGARGVGEIRDEFGQPLVVLMGAVTFVLLIACANVASLLLARASARQHEIAMRLALGAGRARLVRQLITESLVLSLIGGGVGMLFASWSAAALVGILHQSYLDVTLGGNVLWFTLATSVLTGLLFGSAPAVQASRPSMSSALKKESAPFGSRRLDLRTVLVAGQVGISLLLVIGAGLFLRTLANLKGTDKGFHADPVVLARLNPGLSRYTDERIHTFYSQLLERVSALPGVTAASVADQPLLAGAIYDGVLLPGQTPVAGSAQAVAVKLVAPRFFETMGIALRAGRDFTLQDIPGAPKVAIVNEKFAVRFFAGSNPIGNRIGVLSKAADQEVIGVIADTKYRGLRGSVPATVYLPLDQQVAATPARTLHIRSAIPPQHLAGAIRAQIQALDKDLPIGEITSFSSVVDAGLVRERLVATLASFFGALALLLVSIGLYGVIAYSVQRRTREIGIRVSLGAPQSAVVWMVMRQSVWVVAAGLAAGLPVTLWLTRLAKSLLFGVAPDDPVTFACAMLILIITAALAAYMAARRAARVDPMLALRYD